ncbi:histidine kinase [Cohnella sp. LGH]|uniref:cache domain-containing sensor histidine kinase n=1 Tax=unclassified Cohnella TaxID=2636738 RepID=UPI001AD9C45A|nr:sensor histidine kinase [Cohnella sp. LGH]QTH42408.1 histidine kinase [Cohnella sp. LGH]
MPGLKVRKWWKPIESLFAKMVLYYSLITLFSFALFGGIMFSLFSRTMKSDMLTHAQKISNQTNMSLDNYFNEIVTSLEMVATHPFVLSSLSAYDANPSYTNYTNAQQIIQMLQNIKSLKPDISEIFIFRPDFFIKPTITKSVNVNSPFLKNVWKEAEQAPPHMKPIFYSTHVPDYYNSAFTNHKVVSMSYPIRDIMHYGTENLAICFIDFNFEKITQIIEHSKLGQSDRIILLTDSGSVIYSTDTGFQAGSDITEGLDVGPIFQSGGGYYSTEFQEEKLLVTYSTSQVTGWKLVYLSKTAEIQKNVNQTYVITTYLLLGVIVFSILLSVVISRKNAKPMMELMNHMREVGRGNFSIRIPEDDKHLEFKILSSGFNLMTNKINVLFDEVYAGKIKQREAEFKALESNIHPHFLNNTLQVIHSLAVLERSRDIEQVVTALGNLLEYSLYEKEKRVLIFKELNYIEDYLKIQNIRYDHAIRVDIEVEEQVKLCYISKLLLQPIVENAVFHGLDKVADEKILRIRGFAADGQIHFTVEDNGIGMTERELQAVVARLDNNEAASERSIGLSNVQQRIKIEYGPQYGMNFHSVYRKGTKVELVIPILK